MGKAQGEDPCPGDPPTLRTLLEGHLARLGAEHPQGDPAASPTVPKGSTESREGTAPAST